MNGNNYRCGRQNRKINVEILALSKIRHLLGDGIRTRGKEFDSAIVFPCDLFIQVAIRVTMSILSLLTLPTENP